MTTKIPAELSSTPGIADSSNATAITIDSSERVGILQGSPTSNLHIGASGNDAKRELRIDGTNGSGQTYGCIIEADGENGRFVFKVGQSGNTPAQQFMVHPDGGICFGTDTAAANALDDYEEGTFTVSVTADSGTPSVGSVEDTVSYTKIGNKVFINGQIGGVNTSGCSGDLKITMPFAGAASSERSDFYFGMIATNTTSVSYFKLINTTNTNTFIVDTKKPDGTVDGTTATFMASSGSFDLDLSGFHFTTT